MKEKAEWKGGWVGIFSTTALALWIGYFSYTFKKIKKIK